MLLRLRAAAKAKKSKAYLQSELPSWCTGQPPGCAGRWPSSASRSADLLRPLAVEHSVQHLGGDGHLGRRTSIHLRAQPVADDAFSLGDVGLHQGKPVVLARGVLQAHTAALGDRMQVRIPLRRRGFDRGARHRTRKRRDDDGGIGLPRRDRGVIPSLREHDSLGIPRLTAL